MSNSSFGHGSRLRFISVTLNGYGILIEYINREY